MTDSQGEQAPKFDPLASARVSSRVDIRSVELLGLFFKRADDGVLPPEEVLELLEAATSVTGTWELSEVDEAGTRLLGSVMTFELSVPASQSDADTDADEVNADALFIGSTFRTVYELHGDEEPDPADCTVFGYWNGMLTMWPYWRELVQSTLARANLEPIVMPVFRVPAT